MALSDREQAEAWAIIKDSPLVTKWGEPFRTMILPQLSIRECRPGEFVFQPGDPPLYLFIVLAGSVLQRVTDGGQTWLEKEFKPGEFLGQHALFSGEYNSAARVSSSSSARLLQMTAAQLRLAMEQDQGLHEALLHEKRASRMRRLPLLRDLNDEQVRRLAEAVEERELPAGSAIPVAEQPGIWAVDSGQVTLTGPANPHQDDGWDDWRITAGNFIVALPGDAAARDSFRRLSSLGRNRAAETAVAHVNSRLLYIPAAHAERLLNVYPDMVALVRDPAPIADLLGGLDLFTSLTDTQRQHLAQFVGWEFVPARQNITTQGQVGYGYVILREGAAIVTALDQSGRERPRNKLLPIAGFGTTSLLEGKPRDATVRAAQGRGAEGAPGLEGADILTLDRRDLQHAFVERPDLWTPEVPLFSRFHEVKETKVPFDWMQEGEVLHWRDRAHWLWLLGPELAIIVVLFLILVLVRLLLPDVWANIGVTAVILFGLIALPLGAWVLYNYRDDYYALTNRRVTRRDHLLLLYQSRVEVPVEMIQDVTVTSDFWGRVFNYGDVTMRSASRAGAVIFRHVPAPEHVKNLVEEQRMQARAAVQGRQKEELRRGLMSGLQLALAVPTRERALGNVELPTRPGPMSWLRRGSPARQPVAEPTKPSATRFLRNTSGWLPERTRHLLFGPPPPPKQPSGEVLWRKHWLNLVGRAGLPFIVFMLVLVGGLALLSLDTGIARLDSTPLACGWLFLLALAGGWLWWNYEDYRNDVYVVTDDRIIDIEMKPLGLSAKRREGGLDRVQNVDLVQRGILANIFDFGDVVISTAALDEGYTFLMVPNPKLVQTTVFQKLDAFRNRQEQKRAADRQRELIEGIEVYHRLLGQRGLSGRREE